MKTLSARVAALLLIPLALGGCGSGSSGSGAPAADPFVFSTATADRYVRVDRAAQPGLATALLSRDPAIAPLDGSGGLINPGSGNRFNNFDNQRDAFNRGDPINDARDFAGLLTAGPQSNSLRNYHYELGPALRRLGLTPCSSETAVAPANNTQVDISNCVNQVAPIVLPDVLTYNANAPAGWPNGRGFDDPVIDRLLAAALLRISGPAAPHNINSLVGILNPPGDESGTLSPNTFPYMRRAYP